MELIFIVIVIIITSLYSIGLNKKRKCEHEWELVRQEIHYFEYHRTFKCKKCGEKKYIEECVIWM